MVPQLSMTGRLFHTMAMLVPIAVRASVRSASSVGKEKTEMAKAANRPPTAPPTSSKAQSSGLVNNRAAGCHLER